MRSIIRPSQYAAAYKEAKRLHAGAIRGENSALQRLKIQEEYFGSARNMIRNIRRMLEGKPYQTPMSVKSTASFLDWIHRDFSESGLINALQSLRGHIAFNSPKPMTGVTELLGRYERRSLPIDATAIESAVNDIGCRPSGNPQPDRALGAKTYFSRDQKVRDYVVRLAKGKCEYCKCEGFVLPDGSKYIEAHHVISLAKDGADTVDNVIALCANHHREAHFGTGAEALEKKFVEKIAARNRREQPKGC